MSTEKAEARPRTDRYLRRYVDQLEFFWFSSIFIWLAGTIYTRYATGIWLGDHPSRVAITLLGLVFSYMHFGFRLTALMRIFFIISFCYLVHVHLIAPGDFLLSKPFHLGFAHFLLVCVAISFSMFLRSEDYPFKHGVLRVDTYALSRKMREAMMTR